MTDKKEFTTKIEEDFIEMIDTWFSGGMDIWDNDLDRQIAKWFSEVQDVYPKKPYFSPSSLNSCPRELYLKAKGYKRDGFPRQPHQGRWQKLGGLGGDMLQREILMIERHYEKLTGEAPKFRFDRNHRGEPAFEEFVKKNHPIAIDGEAFYLFGAPDGIMLYTTDEGEEIKVGLEIKSKQTTSARTSQYSMREAEKDHYVQTVAYAEMYGCDYYMVVYINYSKKGWNMSDEDYEKTPDIRVFCNHITQQDKFETFLYPAEIQKAVKANEPPKMDVQKWTFNNYKKATADSLTMEEISELETEINVLLESPLPQWQKNSLAKVIPSIMHMRETGGELF